MLHQIVAMLMQEHNMSSELLAFLQMHDCHPEPVAFFLDRLVLALTLQLAMLQKQYIWDAMHNFVQY
jgi:hypothetical protein